MGQIKTEKLDNGMIGFECIYGGLEAPFGGIDASRAPRYIDPRCFADASNFLIVDNELCVCNVFAANFPANGIPYPYTLAVGFGGIPDPADLVGVGTLPCDDIVKNWALYASTGTDSLGYLHYRLILWTNDTTTVETYDLPVYQRQQVSSASNAAARLKVDYNTPLTAIQSITPEVPTFRNDTNAPLTPPISYNNTFYETDDFNLSSNGAPAGYITTWNWGTRSYTLWNAANTASPRSVPNLVQIAADLAARINDTQAAGSSLPLPFKATIDASDPTIIDLVATTMTGFPAVDGSAGNSISLSGTNSSSPYMMYYPPTTGYVAAYITKGAAPWSVGAYTPYANSSAWPFSTLSVVVTVLNQFAGGTDAGQIIYQDKPIQQLTWETVGDVLFLAGYPAGYMLKFDNSAKQFTILTQYQGARVLKKMAGHLITTGIIPGANQVATNTHLWFSWSAPNGNYSEWRTLNSSNLVTGAGGEQLGDISDILTGLIVSNSVAFILRAEGLSYATVLQGADVPWDINHVALCKFGQGCPSTSLWTQFDQAGFYVGNSNVFALQQGPQAVGDKIIGALYPDLIAQSNQFTQFADALYNDVNVEALTLLINNRPLTVYAVNLAGRLYTYSPQDGTWMKLDTNTALAVPPGSATLNAYAILKCVCLPANGVYGYCGSFQYKASYLYYQQIWRIGTRFDLQAPNMLQFLPKVSATQDSYVLFPAEEISHGRDITVDAVYATLCGFPGTVVKMLVSGWQGNPSVYVKNAFVGTVTLDSNAIPDQYEEYQFFNADGSAITLKAPQLQLLVGAQTVPTFSPPVGVSFLPYPQNSNPGFKCSKISMFGSFDPNQRPV